MAFDDSDWMAGNTASGQNGGGWDAPAAQPNAAEDGFNATASRSSAPATGGGVHVGMTFAILLAVASVSFLLSFLTAGMPTRGALMTGLMFALPAAAALFAALGVEGVAAAMTPRFSRGAQAGVALAATLACFVVGCVGNAVYLGGFVQQEDYLFLLDRSSSMDYNAAVIPSANAMKTVLGEMSDADRAGVIVFDHTILQEVPVRPLDAAQRQAMIAALDTPALGSTDFELTLDKALSILQTQAIQRHTRVIMVTDGESSVTDQQAYINRFKQMNASLYCIKIGAFTNADLDEIIQATGGKYVNVQSASLLLERLQDMRGEQADLLRDRSSAANAVTAVLFVLEGLVIGVALWLMLSYRGQPRAQLILSPLMGVAGFLLLKVLSPSVTASIPWWQEAIAFTMFGLVIMCKNKTCGIRTHQGTPTVATAEAADPFDF